MLTALAVEDVIENAEGVAFITKDRLETLARIRSTGAPCPNIAGKAD